MFRILDRYIAREIIPSFLILLLVLTFVLEMQPIMDIADRLVAKGVAWRVIVRVLPTLLPQALALTIPMAFLIGLLMALGRLSADREWVALQACGVSAYRLLRPIGLFAVVAWAATSWVIIDALPSANQSYREITYAVVATRAESEVRPRVFFEDFPKLILYVRDAKPGVPGWSGVFAADTSRAGQPIVYVAERGRMVVDRAKRTVAMVLEDGASYSTTASSTGTEKYEVTHVAQVVLNLDPQTVFPSGGPQKGDREMTIAELRQRIAMLAADGDPAFETRMEIQKKFSIPVACLVFALMGLALGVSNRREGKLASFVLGIAVIFVYYAVMWPSQALAKAGKIPAVIAMWVPDIVLGAIAAVLFLARTRSVEMRLQIPLPFFRRPLEAGAAAPGDPRAAARGRRVVVVLRVPRFRLPHVRLPLPTILDRYVSGIYLRIFLLGFVGLLGIVYISTFIDLSDRLFRGTATLGMFGNLFYYSTPKFVYFVVPIAGLVSTLVTIGLLTKNSELTVMRACGISLYRAALPLLFFAVVGSGLLFLLEENVLADSNRHAEAALQMIRFGSARTVDVRQRNWIVGKDGSIYHYLYFDPQRSSLQALAIYEFDQQKSQLIRQTTCAAAVFDRRKGVWHARDGTVREFRGSARALPAVRTASATTQDGTAAGSYVVFSARDLRLERPEYFGSEQLDADRMSYSQLKRYIAELSASGFNVVPQMVALQRKLAFPFVTLVMTLIAVPFAVTTGSRGALYGIGVGIVLAMIYWITAQVFAAIGSGGLIAPALAAWAPNLMFAAGAAYLLLTVRT